MTEKGINFWQDHSPRYLEMAFRSDRWKTVPHPDGWGKRTGKCGDTVEIYLCVRDGFIQSVAFQTDGCLNTTACANSVAELVEGKNISSAWDVMPQDVIDFLQTLPPDHYHCAELAVGALYRALANYNELQRKPWKKFYR
jgi:nitrogen fixation NifU-like protein